MNTVIVLELIVCEFYSHIKWGVLDTTVADHFVSDLGLWISIDTFATSVNKSYKNDIAKIVLKAALNTKPFVHKKQIIEIWK